jgi:hypothetical protein
MINLFKSGTTLSSGTIRKNNFVIAVEDGKPYGPTASTGFWAGITPPSGGYTMYGNKTDNGPSIFTSTNDTNVIITAQKLGGTNISTIYDALSWFNGQSNRLIVNMDYPSIITNGLILNLDPGYIPSYPRSGSTLYDLSQNQNNNTILDPSIITWTSGTTGGGVLNFSKQTLKQITGGTEANLTSTGVTLSVWVNFSAQTNTINRFITIDSEIAQIRRNSTNLEMAVNAGGSIKAFVAPQTFTNGTWYNTVCTYNSTTSTSTLYVNGVQLSATTSITGALSTSSIGIKISSEGTTECMEGSMSVFQIWNRALSGTEITSNYNALKGRFGL